MSVSLSLAIAASAETIHEYRRPDGRMLYSNLRVSFSGVWDEVAIEGKALSKAGRARLLAAAAHYPATDSSAKYHK